MDEKLTHIELDTLERERDYLSIFGRNGIAVTSETNALTPDGSMLLMSDTSCTGTMDTSEIGSEYEDHAVALIMTM
jgi:hypothetical protein